MGNAFANLDIQVSCVKTQFVRTSVVGMGSVMISNVDVTRDGNMWTVL